MKKKNVYRSGMLSSNKIEKKPYQLAQVVVKMKNHLRHKSHTKKSRKIGQLKLSLKMTEPHFLNLTQLRFILKIMI